MTRLTRNSCVAAAGKPLKEARRKAFAELQLWRQLDEQDGKLFTQRPALVQELVKEGKTIGQLVLVGNDFGQLHRKAEVRGDAFMPTLPRRLPVRPME